MHRLVLLARLGFGLGIVCVIALSVAPATVVENVPTWMIFWDKLQHGIAYASVAGCGGVGFGRGRPSWIKLASGLVALGFTLEVVQYHLPTRSFEVADLFANTTGVAIGLALAAGFLRLTGMNAATPQSDA